MNKKKKTTRDKAIRYLNSKRNLSCLSYVGKTTENLRKAKIKNGKKFLKTAAQPFIKQILSEGVDGLDKGKSKNFLNVIIKQFPIENMNSK